MPPVHFGVSFKRSVGQMQYQKTCKTKNKSSSVFICYIFDTWCRINFVYDAIQKSVPLNVFTAPGVYFCQKDRYLNNVGCTCQSRYDEYGLIYTHPVTKRNSPSTDYKFPRFNLVKADFSYVFCYMHQNLPLRYGNWGKPESCGYVNILGMSGFVQQNLYWGNTLALVSDYGTIRISMITRLIYVNRHLFSYCKRIIHSPRFVYYLGYEPAICNAFATYSIETMCAPEYIGVSRVQKIQLPSNADISCLLYTSPSPRDS